MDDPRQKFWKAYQDTAPDKVTPDKMSDETLKAMHAYFLDGYCVLHDEPDMFHAAEARIALLGGEIAQRRVSKQSDTQHKENRQMGRRAILLTAATLCVAIAATVVGVLQYRASKPIATPPPNAADTLPSTSPLPQNTPLQPTPAPTATAATEAMPTVTPEQSPKLSPTPAP